MCCKESKQQSLYPKSHRTRSVSKQWISFLSCLAYGQKVSSIATKDFQALEQKKKGAAVPLGVQRPTLEECCCWAKQEDNPSLHRPSSPLPQLLISFSNETPPSRRSPNYRYRRKKRCKRSAYPYLSRELAEREEFL